MPGQLLPSFRLRFELTYALVRRDLRARASQSVLGLGWTLVKPLFLTAVIYFVFGNIIPVALPVSGVPYWLHVLVSVLTWQFLVGALTEATHSVVGHGHLLRKVPLDSRVFPAAAVWSHAINYSAGLALVICVAMPVAGIWPSVVGLLLLIPTVIVLLILVFALGTVLATCQVYARDTASALELASTALFYGSPVIYPVPTALAALAGVWGGAAAFLYLCNPAALILAAVRRCLIYPAGAEASDLVLFGGLALLGLVCGAVLIAGNRLFLRLSGNFADRL